MDFILLTMNDKWQTRPFVREGAPYGQDSNFQTRMNIWLWGSTPRPTDWRTVRRNVTPTLASVTIALASRERNSQSTSSSTAADAASDRQRSSAQPAAAGASPPLELVSPLLQEFRPASSWLAITGLLQGVPTLALASQLRRELRPAFSRRARLPTNGPFQGQYHRCH
jgi:hypothetical protein